MDWLAKTSVHRRAEVEERKRSCYRSKKKQQTLECPQFSRNPQLGFSCFYSPKEAEALGSFPRERATIRDSSEPWPLKQKTGHAVGLHLRLEAILNTSPLDCGFVPPSPSRSCSALSMFSRSCSSWSSSLHQKDQKLPRGGSTSYPRGPHVPSSNGFSGAGQAPVTVLVSSISPVLWATALGGKSCKANASSLLLRSRPSLHGHDRLARTL